jgi:hypothetical protein
VRALAVLVCALVLSASAVATARNVDADAIRQAAWRAKLTKALGDEAGGKLDGADCGCTAAIRAKDRVASRGTADDGAAG